ncbi:N-6 DNA methylase, partial [Acinetobacter baumannii]
VEVISNIYELFVSDPTDSVYTPPALVRLILDEVLDDARIDRIIDDGEIVLDPACGSGIFRVEAFKRVVLRWRARNDWAQPDVETLRVL